MTRLAMLLLAAGGSFSLAIIGANKPGFVRGNEVLVLGCLGLIPAAIMGVLGGQPSIVNKTGAPSQANVGGEVLLQALILSVGVVILHYFLISAITTNEANVSFDKMRAVQGVIYAFVAVALSRFIWLARKLRRTRQ